MSYPKFWTESELEKLKSLYNSGLSMREVGVSYGKSVRAIVSAMKLHHIIRRPASVTRTYQFSKSPLSFTVKSNLSQQEELLRVAGLMLYWGEGGKRNSKGIDFANADPSMITVFLRFLRTIYQIDESRLRVYLYSYQSLPTIDLISYWSSLTNIPFSQFTKPYIREKSKQKHDKMSHGLIHIRYSDKRLFELIMSEISSFITSWDGGAVKHTTL